MQPRVGVAAHRAEFQHREDMPTLTNTLRAEEYWARRSEFDQRRHQQKERRERQQRHGADNDIERALSGNIAPDLPGNRQFDELVVMRHCGKGERRGRSATRRPRFAWKRHGLRSHGMGLQKVGRDKNWSMSTTSNL